MKPIFAVLLCAVSSSSSYAVVVSGPGPAPDATAIAEYDFTTGEITVSVNNIINWYVNSLSASLSGPDDASATLPQAGGIVGDNDMQFGELTGSPMTYTDIYLGQVAQTGLPLGDLNIFWNPSVGEGPFSQPVVYVGLPVPEPSSLVLGTLFALGIIFRRQTCRR